MTHVIEIQLPNTTLAEISQFAERFGCKAFRTKNRFFYRLETEDVINFYWLGCNMNNRLLNELMPSNTSKFIEL